MPNIKHYGVAESALPSTGAAGELYFTDKNNQYLVKTDGTLMKITDVYFVPNVSGVASPQTNKLYFQISDNTMYRWNGSAFAQVTSGSNVDLSTVLRYKGGWNATTNTPALTSGAGTAGNFYIVTTAGVTTIDGVSSWSVGDWILYNGTKWERVPNSNAVTSVNGKLGAVVLTKADIDLANVTDDAQVKRSEMGVPNGVALLDASGKVAVLNNVTNDAQVKRSEMGTANGVATLDANGNILMSMLPAAILGALNYKGLWNPATNTPNLSTATKAKGDYYVASVDGTTNIDGIAAWKKGDWAVYNGTTFDKVDNSSAVSSVAGKTGAVVLDKADVGLGNVTNDAQIPLAQKGAANGVASLNANSRINPAHFNPKQAIILRQATAQSLAVGNTFVAWDNVVMQQSADGISTPMWNSGGDKTKVTIQKAGFYHVSGTYRAYNAATFERYIGAIHNGAVVASSGISMAGTSTINVATVIYCAVGDTIQLIFYNGHTAAITSETSLNSLRFSVVEL